MPRKIINRSSSSHHSEEEVNITGAGFFNQFLWSPGCYLNEEVVGETLKLKKAGVKTSGSLSIPRCCYECGLTRPWRGFAPAFSEYTRDRYGDREIIILLCEDCYDCWCREDKTWLAKPA